MIKKFLVAVLILACGYSAALATTFANGPAKEVMAENSPEFVEMYRVRLYNDVNGTVEASSDLGKSWQAIGAVLRPVNEVNKQGYTASKWADVGCVAATAVNSIHINAGYNKEKDRGIIFSIVPKDLFSPPADYKSFYSPSSSMFLDTAGGSGFFGDGYAPFVGNRVYKEVRESAEMEVARVEGSEEVKEVVHLDVGELVPVMEGYVPKVGDTIVIVIDRPAKYPSEIDFENRFGGLITLRYPDGDEKYIGEVLKPVQGVGRFSGTEYTGFGRIRANHCGVIDISTSLFGSIGGIQIIPANHGMSPEMGNARLLTQWMVIGPLSALDPSLEGVAPFFKYFIQPVYGEDDILKDDWRERFLKRFLVKVRMKNGPWDLMPIEQFTPEEVAAKEVPAWCNSALKDVTHIKIVFPVGIQ